MIIKNLDLIIVTLLLIALILFEETIEIVEELFHLIFELLHTAFEWVELGVEDIVDHLFELLEVGSFFEYLFTTERHASQVFTFYILMSFIAYFLFKLAKTLPKCYDFLKQQMLIAWVRRKTQINLYWQSFSQLRKIAIIASTSLVVLMALFIFI